MDEGGRRLLWYGAVGKQGEGELDGHLTENTERRILPESTKGEGNYFLGVKGSACTIPSSPSFLASLISFLPFPGIRVLPPQRCFVIACCLHSFVLAGLNTSPLRTQEIHPTRLSFRLPPTPSFCLCFTSATAVKLQGSSLTELSHVT